MDLSDKSLGELYRLALFTGALIDDLRSVDDTDTLRGELESFSDSIDLEIQAHVARM